VLHQKWLVIMWDRTRAEKTTYQYCSD
jgi:hypothetical protein